MSFPVYTADLCKSCLSEIDTRSLTDPNTEMTYIATSEDFSTGECCFDTACLEQTHYANSSAVSKMGFAKNLICPVAERMGVNTCGDVDGDSQTSKFLQPSNDGGGSALILNSGTSRLNLDSKFQCSFMVRYPSRASYTDKLTIQVIG